MSPAVARHRVRYTVDDDNRLWIGQGQAPPRRVEGAWQVDRTNRLAYLVESREHELPRRMVLDGVWSLTPDHRLALTLRETTQLRRQVLYFTGALVEARARTLAVALDRRAGEGRRTAERLTLTGRWQADDRNRLSFLASRGQGTEDRLTLQGAWRVGTGHELLYQYRRPSRPTNGLAIHTLRFDGTWAVSDARHVVYQLERSGDSAFAFRANLQSRRVDAADGRLVYQVGVGLAHGRRGQTRVELVGQWKVHPDLSVSLELPSVGRRHALRFRSAVRAAQRGQLELELSTEQGEPLGVAVSFNRRLAEHAQWFVRMQKRGEETEALAGVQVRF